MRNSLIAFAVLLICASSAFAHGLNVFAWLENDQIIVQGDFGKGRPAANAQVNVYDRTDNKKLLTGTTNPDGRFSFVVPAIVRQGHGLLVDVNAGQGHRGEWAIDASELYSAASLTAGFDEAAIRAGQMGDHQPAAAPAVAPPMPQGSSEQIRNIVLEALELKLAPIRQEIAKRSGPSLSEIIGGIGWIIGLVGIGFYFKSRKA